MTVEAVVDDIAEKFAAHGGQPGLAYGIVANGSLIHAGGFGECFPDGPVPGPDTSFRIASMSKSFTASLIMLLRDQGDLRLDDDARHYVPELSGVALAAADCPPITIRHLLTMTAGFPTDDPWGDRQQGLPLQAFGQLLARGGVRCAWAPGTRFEYSNLGYAILGRVIAAVTGDRYETSIRDRLLTPLGMTRTGFEASEFGINDLARGYRRDEGRWLELDPDPSGAFAPMGGVFSTVTDLAGWVAGFAAAFPARDDEEDRHPLRRASRREMQLPQVAILGGFGSESMRFAGPVSISYGFGLFAEEDPAFGAISQHSGGYPGYGSHMRWHLATGLGSIVLANGTYAAAGSLAGQILTAVLQGKDKSSGVRQAGPVPAPGTPWPDIPAATSAVNDLLQQWDDEAARRLFTPNVAMDRPLALRRSDIERLRERIGEFWPDETRPEENDSPAHSRWWVIGAHGTACVQIKLAPLAESRVQQLLLAIPPAPGSLLATALRSLTDTLNQGGRDWPEGVDTTVNSAEVLRQLRVASAWAGHCEIDSYQAGDGSVAVTAELTGPTGRVSLTVEVAEQAQRVQRVEVSLLRRR